MNELLTQWGYWVPILLSTIILLLYAVLISRSAPLIPLIPATLILLLYLLITSQYFNAFHYCFTLPVVIPFTCAADCLFREWRSSSKIKCTALIIFLLLPLVFYGVFEAIYAGDSWGSLFVHFLMTAVYVFPRNRYAKGYPGRHLSLWAVQWIIMLLITFPSLIQFGFRILFVLKYETGLLLGIWLAPVLACTPLLAYDLYTAKSYKP